MQGARASTIGLRPLTNKKKARGVGFRRQVPLLLLALLSLYGAWFLYTAQSAGKQHMATRAIDPGKYTDEEDAQQPPAASVVDAARPLVDDPDVALCNQSAARGPPKGMHALGFGEEQYLELTPSAEAQLDVGALTISAWVKLPKPEGTTVASIRTVAASKASGCDAKSEQYGLALFVNAWNTDSGQLFLSWGNDRSGCEELATRQGAIPTDTWTFVAATISAEGEAALYVNGVLLAHTARSDLGGETRIVGGLHPMRRGAAPTSPMWLGGHRDETHWLRGFVASFAIHKHELSPAEQRTLMCGGHATLPTPPLVLVSTKRRSPSTAATSGHKERAAHSITLEPLSSPVWTDGSHTHTRCMPMCTCTHPPMRIALYTYAAVHRS